MSGHTKLPWSVHGHDGYMGDGEMAVAIVGADGVTVVADNVAYYPTAITPENATLIARAVNAHEALLTGLQSIVDRADNGELGTSKVQDMRRLAADLLAKHGGAS